MSYDRSWDCPHQPNSTPHWQESDCYWFFDIDTGVGGFHRIGQTPNTLQGQVDVFVFARDGERFISDPALRVRAIVATDRWTTGHRVDTHVAESLAEHRLRFAWREPGCSADLEFFESFHPPRNWSRTDHADLIMRDINPDGHLECSGRLRGSVRIGERSYAINALAHRDRSWGVRGSTEDISLHRYRMFSGTAGPALSFACFGIDSLQNGYRCAGFVVRDDVAKDVVDLRCLTSFDFDGISPIGATAIITMADGEQLRLVVRPVQGRLGVQPGMGVGVSDTICVFDYQGHAGFIDLEMCTNPGRGAYQPTPRDVSLLGTVPGLSTCSSYGGLL